MAANSYLQVENVSKAFGEKVLFRDISFGLSEGQKMALIAQNGKGKTTLLNIISGKDTPDEGSVTFRKDLRVSVLEQSPAYAEGSTVLDACFQSNSDVVRTIAEYEKQVIRQETDHSDEAAKDFDRILSQMDILNAWDYEAKAKQVLGKLNIHNLSQPTGELSGGQIKRIALANALITEPDLLILDEPTNHLDLEMVEWLEDFLRNSTMTLFMVTHDRYFLDHVCSDILEIDRQTLFHYKGNYAYYLEKRDERLRAEASEIAKANNLYRRELEWMRRMPQARGTKAQSRIDAFYETEAKAKQRPTERQVQLQVKSSYIGNKIFEAKYVSKAFGNLVILDNFYYNFSRYEKLGIVGRNGTGKSTFVKMLIGEEKPDSGTFDIGDTVTFGYYGQMGMTFDEQTKVIDVVRDIAEEIDLGGGRKMSASQFLEHFLFAPETQHNYVYKLSGGEKRRLYLCTVLIKNPNFLVLDEPTNDLDIVTLGILENYLQTFRGCVIIVSHDRYFMDKVVDHLLFFEGDGKIKDFPGNYTDFRRWRENEAKLRRTLEKQENKPAVPVAAPKKEKKKLSYKEQKEFEQLEKEITEMESEKSAIEQQMSAGQLSGDELLQKSERIGALLALIDEKTMRWLELSEIQ